LLLIAGAVLVGAVAAAFAAGRLGLPVLVAFLGLGMALGSDGPGGIDFDDADLARTIGVVGLVAILFEGGLTTPWRGIRPVITPAAVLATLGVVVTAAVTAAAGGVLFDLSARSALVLGAVVASTDAAAVFATLRFTPLRRRLARLLEAESGLNDPMAVALTIGFIDWVQHPSDPGVDVVVIVVQELSVGLVVGLVLGAAAAHLAQRVPESLTPFAPVGTIGVAAVSYGAAAVIGGSGFLAVYLVGLRLGNTWTTFRRSVVSFHQGLAFVAQVALFLVLGLLVFPSELGEVALASLALTVVLLVVARPAAVWLSTAWLGFTNVERLFLSWAGLRGAVPIVLATFALSEGIGASNTIFNAVFFVVLVSAVVQGPTIEPLARRLGLVARHRPHAVAPLEQPVSSSLDLLEYAVEPDDAIVGMRVRELGLPRDALVAVIVRAGEPIPPRGRTTVEPGDRLYVLAHASSRPAVEALFAQWEAGEPVGA
jgi:cell volume regulation protein A